MTESFVFDFDEIDNNGSYCKLPPYFLPPLTGFVEQVTGPFLRERDHVRRILIHGTLRNLAAAGDPMSAVLHAWKLDDDAARAAVAEWSQRHAPEALAVIRAARAAHPYQRCRAEHGCGHPCSCPIRNTTSERNAP